MWTRIFFSSLLAASAAFPANLPARSIPLFFIPTHGGYVAKGSGLTASFTATGVAYRTEHGAISLEFENTGPLRRLEGGERLPGRVNFLLGERPGAQTGLAMYGSVRYRELYPGIDLVYGGDGRNLKSEFRLAAGADPAAIRMRFAGTSAVAIAADGSLEIVTQGGELREAAPVAYQEEGGKRNPVAARFAIERDGSVGFIVNRYDSKLPLVIDPVVAYSTLLGGSSTDADLALAVDSTGAVYLAGYTASFDFPTVNPVQSLNGGGNDVFVAKLNPAGNALVYCTYLGGTGDDRAYGIAVDSAGAAYVTGSTASKNFPVVLPLQSKLAGTRNAFVLKLNAAGNALVFSTYLGGSGSDTGYGIAVDKTGSAYVTGDTTSSTFPATGFQKSFHGVQDAFVSKLSADGSHLVYSTFLGGAASDHGAAVAVDAGGGAYVTGATYSTDFPVAGAFQGTNAGGQDAFLARLSPDGNSLSFSTYFGGSGGSVSYPESGQALALDAAGNIYIAGSTNSPNLPMVQPLQASLDGWEDAFVAKFTSAGWPVYSTYLGGSGMDYGNALAVDAAGNAYVAGYTYSTDLPTINAVQPNVSLAGDVDAFVAILNPAGNALLYLSYLGGPGTDTASAIALDAAGGIYVAGWTFSTSFPLLHPLQTANGGNYGAFVAKLQQVALGVTCTHSGSFLQGQNGSYTVTVSNSSTVPSSGTVTVNDTLSSGLTLVSLAGAGWTCTGATCVRGDALAAGASYPALTATVKVASGAVSPQQNTVTVYGGGDLLSHSAIDATVIQTIVTYTISGNVSTAGAGMAGVTVTLSGGQSAATVTDSAGNYAFAGVAGGGSYTVTPLAAGYGFTPLSQPVTGLAGNQILNFTGAANLAQGKNASQSATYLNAAASLAIDGKTDGSYPDGSVSIAGYGANAWWQVDLGASAKVSSLALWGRTDCCAGYLSDYWVFVSDTPFNAGDTPATLQSRAATWSNHQTAPPSPSTLLAAGGAQGRYVRVQLTGTGYVELAEVQVFGSWANTNLAQGKTATQSATYSTAVAGLAVDGRTDGAYPDGSVAIAGYNVSPWWQVDLGASTTLSSLTVWGRTDCCASYLSDYWIFVSDTPFNAGDTPATLQSRAGTWSSHQTTAPAPSTTIAAAGVQGRYIRVQLSGAGYLEIAELQAFGSLTGSAPADLAQGKTATQNATYASAAAGLAVDGRTDGVYADGSVAIAGYGTNSWWQVDLGASATISAITLWGRTDCCAGYLSDYWIFVSDTPFTAADTPATLQSRAATWSSHQTTAPDPASVITTTGVSGRYIRVQLSNAGYLELAEVQVAGSWR